MKKIIIFLVAIVLFAACTKTPSYQITGDILGQEGTIYLTHKANGKWVNSDSTEMVAGIFTFIGTVNGPEQYRLTFKNNKRAKIPFIIENSIININADLKKPASNKITGSVSQDVMNKWNEVLAPFNEKKVVINKQYGEAQKAKDEKKIEELFAEHNIIQANIHTAMLDFIKANNKSYTAAILASRQRKEKADEIDELVSILDASLMDNYLVIKMKERAEALRNIEIGKIAPDFVLNDTLGQSVRLSSLLGKGYLLVDFWAAWCGPCRNENPLVLAAYNKFHEKGFDVIGISLDRASNDAWRKAIQDDKLPWTQVLDYTDKKVKVAETYMISSIPSNFLLDNQGKIIARNLRGEALEEKLAKLLD